MALDFADKLNNNDLVLVRTDKYRAFNLLRHKFVDNPGIGLDLAGMVSAGLDDNQIETIITQYLSDFGVKLLDMDIKSENGKIRIDYEFGGEYV